MKGHIRFKGNIITKQQKYTDEIEKFSYLHALGRFQPSPAQSIFGFYGLRLVLMKGHVLIQREIRMKWKKYIDEILKMFFPRTTGPNSTKLCVKEVVFINKDHLLLQQEIMIFFSFYQRYGIIIALRIYIYILIGTVFQVSDVAHGPFV